MRLTDNHRFLCNMTEGSEKQHIYLFSSLCLTLRIEPARRLRESAGGQEERRDYSVVFVGDVEYSRIRH